MNCNIVYFFFIFYKKFIMNRNIDKLYNWFSKNGGNHNTYFKENKNETTLYFSKDLKENHLICYVPYDLMITEDSFLDNYECEKDIEEIIEKASFDLRMALFLYLEDMNKNSNFKRFIDSFPETDHILLSWNADELKKINETYLYQQYLSIISLREEFYYKLKDKGIINISFDLFNKYITIVTSRSFAIRHNEKEKVSLCPIADLINHSLTPNCYWQFNNLYNRFEIRALKDCKKDEEILLSYGNKEDNSFLLYYGFYPSQKNDLFIFSEKKYLKEINKEDKQLKIFLEDKFSKYRSTIEEDKKKLSESNDTNEINICKVLINEKEQIKNFLEKINKL